MKILAKLAIVAKCKVPGNAVGSENRQWGPVAPFGSKPWRGGPGPEIHQKIDNFKTYNIYSS